ncbi:hypothetical protein [Streptomyces capoamus]
MHWDVAGGAAAVHWAGVQEGCDYTWDNFQPSLAARARESFPRSAPDAR